MMPCSYCTDQSWIKFPHSAPNLPTEQHLEQSVGLAGAFFSEHHRFCLAHRICDVSLLVQSSHDIPIEAFPGSVALVTPQMEQRQNRLVDLFGVDVHGYILLLTGRLLPAVFFSRFAPAHVVPE